MLTKFAGHVVSDLALSGARSMKGSGIASELSLAWNVQNPWSRRKSFHVQEIWTMFAPSSCLRHSW